MYSYIIVVGQGEDSLLEFVVEDMETDVFENDVSVNRVVVVAMVNGVVRVFFLEEERNPFGIGSLDAEGDESILE